MAGIALIAGSALAFTTAKSNQPLPCDHPSVPQNCTEETDEISEACCFEETGSGIQYYRLEEN